jgi:hypothetical protein
VWEVPGVELEQSDQMLQEIPTNEALWDCPGLDRKHFLDPYYQWLEFPLSPQGMPKLSRVQESAGMNPHLWNSVLEHLTTKSGSARAARGFLARYKSHTHWPHKGLQWALEPHRDEGNCTMLLALRPKGTFGGALVLSDRPDGNIVWQGPGHCRVKTLYTRTFAQHHGDVLRFHGHKVDHYVTPTTMGDRYVVGIFVK